MTPDNAPPEGRPSEMRSIRRALGVTQAQMAARLGVDQNTVARWERGERSVSEPAIRLARTLVNPPTRSWALEIRRRLRGTASLRRHGRASEQLMAARAALSDAMKTPRNDDICRAACRQFDDVMRAEGRHLGSAAPLRP